MRPKRSWPTGVITSAQMRLAVMLFGYTLPAAVGALWVFVKTLSGWRPPPAPAAKSA